MHLTRSQHFIGCAMHRPFRTKFADKLMHDIGQFMNFAGDYAFCPPRLRNVSSH